MDSPFDTIVAPITAEGGAIAVVRVSGPESWGVASRVFQPWPEPVRPRHALYGSFVTGDDGICLPFEDGHSYTGESSVEFSVHGSRPSVRAFVEACVHEGGRLARPGEFTERAFLNGRIDLTQAEGIRDSIEAETDAQFRQASLLREGHLRNEVGAIREAAARVLAAIEASVDFSEEIGELDKAAATASLSEASSRLDALLRTAESGRILRRGFRIALVGPPNAGKSSLLNRLLGFDRSIVTEHPGTTRDFVEERIDLGGIPCVVTDTAGLRAPGDPIERLGIDRARRVAEAADEIWYVVDATSGWTSSDEEARRSFERPCLVLANKSDLLKSGESPDLPAPSLLVSALSGDGLDELVRRFADRVGQGGVSSVWINDRHQVLLAEAKERLSDTRATLGRDLPADLATVHLQGAIQALGQVTGEVANQDMLETIFRTFCIGK